MLRGWIDMQGGPPGEAPRETRESPRTVLEEPPGTVVLLCTTPGRGAPVLVEEVLRLPADNPGGGNERVFCRSRPERCHRGH
jgi:hypothetical protein